MKKKISDTRIVLATHYHAYSASQALRDYLRQKKCLSLFYIAHPLFLKDAKNKNVSFVEISTARGVIKKFITKNKFTNIVVSSIFEFYLLIKWIMKTRQIYDLYIGVDNLNALQGLILRKFGKVKKVVYYTIDYFPTRFENKLLNWLYYTVDKICVKNADETWNVSSKMTEAREKYNGMDRNKYNRQYEVPIGVWFDARKVKDFGKIDKTKMIFVGHLLPYMGVDMVIKSLPLIAEKIENIKLEIVGEGEEHYNLINLSKKLGVYNRIRFHGWVMDRKKLEAIISSGAVGLATFNTGILDDKVKNADPGKIKDYMQVGMPVIFTDAISTAGKITKAGAGILIKYSSEELAEVVIDLINSPKTLKNFRDNVAHYIEEYNYSKIFYPNLIRIINR